MDQTLPKILNTAQLQSEQTTKTKYLATCFLLLEVNSDRLTLKQDEKYLVLGRYGGDTKELGDLYINVSSFGEAVTAISKHHIAIESRKKQFGVYPAAKTQTEYQDSLNHFIAEPGKLYAFNDGGKLIIGNVRINLKVVSNFVLSGAPYRVTQYDFSDELEPTSIEIERVKSTPGELHEQETLLRLEKAIFSAVQPLLQNHSPEHIRIALSKAENKLLAQYAKDKQMIRACNAIIHEIRQIARVKEHPTNFELTLKEFIKNGGHLQLHELEQLCVNADNPEHAARILVSKLNAKLAPYGLEIRRHSIYQIITTQSPSHK